MSSKKDYVTHFSGHLPRGVAHPAVEGGQDLDGAVAAGQVADDTLAADVDDGRRVARRIRNVSWDRCYV
jgi:hypothetical protein